MIELEWSRFRYRVSLICAVNVVTETDRIFTMTRWTWHWKNMSKSDYFRVCHMYWRIFPLETWVVFKLTHTRQYMWLLKGSEHSHTHVSTCDFGNFPNELINELFRSWFTSSAYTWSHQQSWISKNLEVTEKSNQSRLICSCEFGTFVAFVKWLMDYKTRSWDDKMSLQWRNSIDSCEAKMSHLLDDTIMDDISGLIRNIVQ